MEYLQFVLSSRPTGLPDSGNFSLEKRVLGQPGENEVLLKPMYLSVDPYMRGRMNNVKSYAANFELDKPIMGGAVARVVESRSDLFLPGDTVKGNLPWATYCIERTDHLKKIDVSKFPPGYYLGVLGMPGYTAYFGMMDICKPQKGETVVVSGAAGAVGIVAGQIAKINGARVVGISGTDEKCSLLRDQFGYDDTVNYKTSNSVRKDLMRLCPDGIDAYFDNVGGEITDAVIANLRIHARIALCGQISHYNDTRIPVGPSLMPVLLTKRVLLKGFIVGDYHELFDVAHTQLSGWLDEGKLKFTTTVIEGFEKLPEAFIGLFKGNNIGKMLVKTD